MVEERKGYLLFDNQRKITWGTIYLTQELFEAVNHVLSQFNMKLISNRLPDGSVLEYITD